MLRRRFLAALAAATGAATVGRAAAQQPGAVPRRNRGAGKWRKPAVQDGDETSDNRDAADDERPTAKVSTGDGTLPNAQGQIWRQYDIRSYTVRVTTTQRPEQAMVDWVLRETGYEAWHADTVALLCADQNTLYCYHTPEMQERVAEIVDRFVEGVSESQSFGVRVATVGGPSWRAKHHAMLRPVETQTQGIAAWVLAREDAAVLLADLRRRNDFHEHAAPQLFVQNGQAAVIGPAPRSHPYAAELAPRPDVWPGFETRMAQFDEGFSCEFSPLLSLDGTTIDAALKCHIDQLERLAPTIIDVPTGAAGRQRVKIETPQVAQYRLQERFRWPADKVLVVGLGIVPAPLQGTAGLLDSLPLVSSAPRADLLVFIESRGRANAAAPADRNAQAPRARY